MAQAHYYEKRNRKENADAMKRKFAEMKDMFAKTAEEKEKKEGANGKKKSSSSASAPKLAADVFKMPDSEMQALADDITSRFGFSPVALFGNDWFNSL